MENLSIQEPASVDDSELIKWGLHLTEIYVDSLKFYKEKSGKAIHLSYEENLKLVAFTQQASHGPLLDVKNPKPLGLFDVIGADRRKHWQVLGNMSKIQAMESFIDLLDRLCPSFKPYIEAIKKDKEEKLKLSQALEYKQKEAQEVEKNRLEQQKLMEFEKNREEIQRRKLQDALNSQTYYQFKEYAEKQFPGNPDQQAVLIRQLQNEHYHQYLQQLQSQAKMFETGGNEQSGDNSEANCNEYSLNEKEREVSLLEEKDHCESDIDNESGEYAVIQPANMWTRHDIKEFKREVMSVGKGDGVLRVGHGDVVTVRVPTLEGGSSLFWEFATDNYDIGFGVYFEWGKPENNEVSVHVSESDDDDDLIENDNDDDEEITCLDDLESGSTQMMPQATAQIYNRPPLSIIIPVYRRECQNEVYAGSHNYPGEGTYLLKFDNSFSLWRSKTLFYRIFYTR
ncbi:unnamed protein product [Diamesa serratosioi]